MFMRVLSGWAGRADIRAGFCNSARWTGILIGGLRSSGGIRSSRCICHTLPRGRAFADRSSGWFAHPLRSDDARQPRQKKKANLEFDTLATLPRRMLPRDGYRAEIMLADSPRVSETSLT